MSAGDSLGRQFFHGTTAELQPGDVVRPGAEVGKNNYERLKGWRNQHVWMTDDPQRAHDWAQTGSRGDVTHAYEVEPAEAPSKRRKLGGGPKGAEYTASSAKVVRRVPRHQQGNFNTTMETYPSGATELSVYAKGYRNDVFNNDRNNFR